MTSARLALISTVVIFAWSGPALAQHPRLEEAWAACDRIVGEDDPEAALAAVSLAKGFPGLEPSVFGFRNGDRPTLVLSIERPLSSVAHCRIVHDGGTQADMVARAARFWSARDYVATSRPSTVYSAVEDEGFTSVSLRQTQDGLWMLDVEWDTD